MPGYRKFLKFMRDEYVPNCRDTIAASALPNGRDYYRHCARKFTTLDDLTPEEIHAIGKAEVERIRGEMDEIISESASTATSRSSPSTCGATRSSTPSRPRNW